MVGLDDVVGIIEVVVTTGDGVGLDTGDSVTVSVVMGLLLDSRSFAVGDAVIGKAGTVGLTKTIEGSSLGGTVGIEVVDVASMGDVPIDVGSNVGLSVVVVGVLGSPPSPVVDETGASVTKYRASGVGINVGSIVVVVVVTINPPVSLLVGGGTTITPLTPPSLSPPLMLFSGLLSLINKLPVP